MVEEKVQQTGSKKPDRVEEPLGKDAVKAQANKVQRLCAALGNAVPRTGENFEVKNVVRRVQTRLRRAASPGRLRFRQHVAGRRLLRGQTMVLKPKVFELWAEQIYRGVLAGALEVVDPEGVRYFVDGVGNLCKREPGKPLEKREPAKPEPPTNEELETEPEKTELEKTEEKSDTTADLPAVDDLTELPGVGPGRAKKLRGAAITTFKQVARMTPADLMKLVGSPLTEDQAAEICDAAREEG